MMMMIRGRGKGKKARHKRARSVPTARKQRWKKRELPLSARGRSE